MRNISELSRDELFLIKKLIDEGVDVKLKVKDLNDSLKESIEGLSEKLDINKKVLRKAIRIAFHKRLKESQEDIIEKEIDLLEEISYLLNDNNNK